MYQCKSEALAHLSATGLGRPQLLPSPAQFPLERADLHLQHVGLYLVSGEGAVSLKRRLKRAVI